MIASGAGSEMRQSLGTAVFAGILVVALFGLVFSRVSYADVRRFFRAPLQSAATRSSGHAGTPAA